MNIEQVEKLMYEIELENDKLLAEEEKMAEHNSDYQVWVKFYNELNEKNIQNKIKINQLELELKTISRKEQLLNGELTRKDKNRKEEIISEIEKLNEEIKVNNKNKKDASETCKEIIEKSQNFESSKKINKIKEVIDSKIKEIDDIYNESKNTIEEHDRKINDVIEKIKNASINNETDKVISYSIELSKLQEEKNGKYYDSQKIIDFIKKNNLVNNTEKENNIEKNNSFTQETPEVLGIEDKNKTNSNGEKSIDEQLKEEFEKQKQKIAAKDVKEDILPGYGTNASDSKEETKIESIDDDLEGKIVDATKELMDNEEKLKSGRKNTAVQIETDDKEEQLQAYNYLKNKINQNLNNASKKVYDEEFEKERVKATEEVLSKYSEYNENLERIENALNVEKEPKTDEFTVEEIEPSKENEKLEALKEQFNISKEFIKNSALKIKNVAKLGLDKSKIIASKIKNSKVVAGAIEAIENDMEKNRGRV